MMKFNVFVKKEYFLTKKLKINCFDFNKKKLYFQSVDTISFKANFL